MKKIDFVEGLDEEASVDDQALYWFVKFRSGSFSEGERSSYRYWMKKNIKHIEATVDLEEFWQTISEFGNSPEILKARHEARQPLQRHSGEPSWWARLVGPVQGV